MHLTPKIKNYIFYLVHTTNKYLFVGRHSEFNPIDSRSWDRNLAMQEYVFSMLRNEINRNPIDTIEKIEETIKNFIKNVKKETLENIFNNCIEKINNFIK